MRGAPDERPKATMACRVGLVPLERRSLYPHTDSLGERAQASIRLEAVSIRL